MRLSIREFEIVERIALGASKKEVASNLHRSVYTIETTIKNVYEKLEINKLSDLVLWYCGIKFNIADQIASVRNKIIISSLIFIFSIHGYQEAQFSRRITRRSETFEKEIFQARVRRIQRSKSANINKALLKNIA